MGVTVGMWVGSCSPLAYAYVDSLIKQSRHHLKVNQAIKRCTKARSSNQDRILVDKILIAVADGSTGHIAVTTPCSPKGGSMEP